MKEDKNNELILKLKEFIKIIKNKYQLKCVILFGSRARGDYLDYSDIDLIVVGQFTEKFINRGLEFYENLKIEKAIDVFCYTPEEFKEMFLRGIVSILDAIDEGICLYGKEFFQEYRQKLKILKEFGLRKDPPVWILPKNIQNISFD
ncbi:MAG: nucleotidyltransferase domain-containing protein [Promethearchaeota archaeon]